MSASRFLRRSRRGTVLLAVSLCLPSLFACGEFGARREPAHGNVASGESTPGAPSPAGVSPDLLPAPADFEATGTARWDGRRTLQGVWVAHPQATKTRRVRIYNTVTGAAADGALFTGRAALSGPSVLVSSDAARLLGMTPGENTEVRIVALTLRTQAGTDMATQVDQALGAKPTIAAAVPAPTGVPSAASSLAPAAAPPVARETEASAVLLAAPLPQSPATPVLAVTPPPGPGTAPDAIARRAGPAPAAAAAPEPQAARTPEAPVPPSARVAVAGDVPVAKSAAIGESNGRVLSASRVQPPVAHPPVAQPLIREPYVQAGLFAVPENATRLIHRLEAEGMRALGKPARLAGRPATRVLAGPFATATERDAARRRIQAMGLRDAVPVAQ